MIVEYDEETGQVSVQFPDVWLAVYPAGVKREPRTGKAIHYRGAMMLKRGSETIHLNAFDIDDLERFLTHPDIKRVRRVMTEQHVKMNIFRAFLSLGGGAESDD